MKSNGNIGKYISEHRSILCFIVNFFCVLAILIIFWLSKTLEDYNRATKLSLIVFAADIIISAAIIIIGRKSRDTKFKKKVRGDIKSLLEHITLDLIYGFSFPVLITDLKDYIVWHNTAALEYLAGENSSVLMGKSVLSVSNGQLSAEKFYDSHGHEINSKNIMQSENNGSVSPVDVIINDRYFRVSFYKLSPGVTETTELNIFVFADISEIEALKGEAEMKAPAAAYFMIDNLDEANHKTQEKYRTASGAVSDLLTRFIENCGGVIKEYDKDKYLCFFENRALNNFIKSKFSILDAVRDIKIEELNMPVTISGGVSNISGSFAEKEAAARRALDMALQRGGDQVVVKSVSSEQFYGGKTKTVQKRTKVKSRVTANELEESMRSSSNVLIMGHKAADNDSIGACIGLARMAKSVNCEVNIIVNIHDANLKSAFTKLRGLEDYKDIFIDEAAALDKITAETLAIITDVNNPQIFESEAVYKNIYKCAIIDHHRKIVEYAKKPDIEYIEPSASSASELVAEMLEQSLVPGELLKEEAELLLAGIVLDTKNFTRNTGTRTFAAAVYLKGEGADPSGAQSLFKTNAEEFIKEAQFAANTFLYRNTIAISVVEDEASPVDKTAGAKAAERMLGIDGVSAAFVIFRIEDTINISARSLGKVNVQIILEAFGGGGHFEMAGAQVKNASFKEVLTLLRKTIDEYFDLN